jgi:hypothetical protein
MRKSTRAPIVKAIEAKVSGAGARAAFGNGTTFIDRLLHAAS